jgi:hypothetical protein
MTTDKTLRQRKTYAREGDPNSPFIWGRNSDLLEKGGAGWDTEEVTYLKTKKGTPRKPRKVEFYTDEFLTEPDPNVSSIKTIGLLMWAMVVAGWTFDECESAMLDPRNAGCSYWHWRSLTDPEWSDFVKSMWHGRVETINGVGYTLVPVSSPVCVPEGNAAFHPHPEVSLLNPSTGEVCNRFILGNTYYTPSTGETKTFTYDDDLLARVVECIASTHGMGVRECITASRCVIKSERVAKSYVYEAVARGLAQKEDNGPGRKSPVSITGEGRAFLQAYLDTRAAIALAKRLAAMPTPIIESGDGLTPEDVLRKLGISA